MLAQKPWIVPIPGTTELHRLEESIGGAAITLAADDLRDIEEAAAKISIQGARHPEALERMSNRQANALLSDHDDDELRDELRRITWSDDLHIAPLRDS
jgi:aryl-alcohol dehydrogenase-like predicted oxidoreductase